jgi:gluconokinase
VAGRLRRVRRANTLLLTPRLVCYNVAPRQSGVYESGVWSQSPLNGETMFVVLMGVAGSGKTTIGRKLAAELGWKFYDADDFHPAANVEKMARGAPLDDADRKPWLEALRDLVRGSLERGERAVLACSALKESYRAYLLSDGRVKLVYLRGDYELIRDRLKDRRGHFMKPQMLDSQFATLEEPEQGVQVDISAPPEEIIEAIRSRLGV